MDSTITKDVNGQKFLANLVKTPAYGGLDLAAVNDLTAFALVWPIKDLVYSYVWYWLPDDQLAERSRHDGVPYQDWWKQGYLEVTHGCVTDWRMVTSRIKELAKVFNIVDLGYDAWGARDCVADLMDAKINVVDVSQSISSMSAPTKRFEELVLSRKLVHSGHPIVRWNLDCTTIYTDVNNNVKLEKPNIKKSSKRIDGIVATVIAISRLQKSPPPFKSVYGTRGILNL